MGADKNRRVLREDIDLFEKVPGRFVNHTGLHHRRFDVARLHELLDALHAQTNVCGSGGLIGWLSDCVTERW